VTSIGYPLLLPTVLTLLQFHTLPSKMFPFLLLPREVRNKIYGCLLEGPDGDNFLFLHSQHEGVEVFLTEARSEKTWTTLPGEWRHVDGWSPSGGLPLFRTCKIVRSEAAASLYGRNWFIFNDEGSEPQYHAKRMTPYCSISHMYDFLRIIGSENRKSIRRFMLAIHHPAYLIHKDDPVDAHSSLFCRPFYPPLFPPLFPPFAGPRLGEHLVNVFDILSQGHSLDVVGFWFEGDQRNRSTLRSILLRDVPKSVLLQTIMKLTGSIKLAVCAEYLRPVQLTDNERAVWRALASHLAGPSEDQLTLSEGKVSEPQAHNTSHSQLQLSKRHTELTKRIEERNETLAQWEKLQLWIQKVEEQGRHDEAERKEIEESMNRFDQIFVDWLLNSSLL